MPERKGLTRGEIGALPRELQRRLFRVVPRFALEGIRRGFLRQHMRLLGHEALADEVLAALAANDAWRDAPGPIKNAAGEARSEENKGRILRKAERLSALGHMSKVGDGLRHGFRFRYAEGVGGLEWTADPFGGGRVEIRCEHPSVEEVLLLRVEPMEDALLGMLEVAPAASWKVVE